MERPTNPMMRAVVAMIEDTRRQFGEKPSRIRLPVPMYMEFIAETRELATIPYQPGETPPEHPVFYGVEILKGGDRVEVDVTTVDPNATVSIGLLDPDEKP